MTGSPPKRPLRGRPERPDRTGAMSRTSGAAVSSYDTGPVADHDAPGSGGGDGPASGSVRRRMPAAKPGSRAVTFLLIALAVPVILPLGPFNMSVYKVALLLLFFPAFFRWLGGQAGRIRPADVLILLFCLWVVLTYAIMHPPGKWIERGVLLVLETFGAYVIARTYIRSRADFEQFVRTFCILIAFLGSFGLIEALRGSNPINDILDPVFQVVRSKPMEPRFGLNRASGPFDHSILFGVFCSLGMALSFFVLGFRDAKQKGSRLWTMMVGLAVFVSLSVGAYLSVIVQVALASWDYVLRKVPARWWILFLGFSSIYIFLELASNRGPLKLFFSYATFSPQAAYIRLDIWNYGVQNVWANPIMGLGIDSWNWKRPDWLPPSVDNMWLLIAMRHGLVGVGLLVAGYLSIVVPLARRQFQDARLQAYRKAALFTIFAVSLATFTVHLWEAPYVMFNFIFGAFVWMLDPQPEERYPPDEADDPRSRRMARARGGNGGGARMGRQGGKLTRKTAGSPARNPGAGPARNRSDAGRETKTGTGRHPAGTENGRRNAT